MHDNLHAFIESANFDRSFWLKLAAQLEMNDLPLSTDFVLDRAFFDYLRNCWRSPRSSNSKVRKVVLIKVINSLTDGMHLRGESKKALKVVCGFFLEQSKYTLQSIRVLLSEYYSSCIAIAILMENKKEDRVMEAAITISGSEERSEVLEELALKLCDAGLHEKALDAANAISSEIIKSDAFMKLVLRVKSF